MAPLSRCLNSLLAILCLVASGVVAKSRSFDLTVTWELGAPDGFERLLFKVNGLFPGPALELDEGDDVVVDVKNLSPFNTSIHFHGIEQQGTPWSDGTPGLSQSDIVPGGRFVYQWTATQHGSFFYHAHSKGQMQDGLMGAITIHPGPSSSPPYELISSDPKSLAAMRKAERGRIPLLLNDWAHYTSIEAWQNSLENHAQNTCQDSMLINGKGLVRCLTPQEQNQTMSFTTAGLLQAVPGSQLTDKSCLPPAIIAAFAAPGSAKPNYDAVPKSFFYGCEETNPPDATPVWPVTQQHAGGETWVMFDLVGAYSEQLAFASFDELPMHVIAVDGNYIEPQIVESLQVDNGEHYTILVNPKLPKKYTFRLSATAPIQIMWATGILDFKIRGRAQSTEASLPYINGAGTNTSASVKSFDLDNSPPYPPSPPPATADATYKLTMQDYGIYLALNETALPQDTDELTPLLFRPQAGREDNTTVTISSEVGAVDYIISSAEGGPTHPIHMHGKHFYVIGRGIGNFTWATVEEAMAAKPHMFNLVNPPLRDTMPTLEDAYNWMVLRRPGGNPGVWFLHCHILNHLQGGQGIIIQEGTDNYPAIPQQYIDQQW